MKWITRENAAVVSRTKPVTSAFYRLTRTSEIRPMLVRCVDAFPRHESVVGLTKAT